MKNQISFSAEIALLAIALTSCKAEADASSEFDLVCSPRNGEVHFRLDLQNRKWCVSDCQSVWSINEISDAMIKIETYEEDGSRDWIITINRYTSQFSAVHYGYGEKPADEGQCRVEPFTGFPGKRF